MNVNFNLISATLAPEDQGTVIDNIKSIEALLPFAVTLPTEVKMGLARAGVKKVDFIDKSYDYLVKNPNLSPNYLDMAEFEKDAVLLKQLQEVMNHLVPLVNKLSDTYALVGSEAYNAARVFYHHAKNAARINVPGASAIAKELGKHFQQSRSPKGEEKQDTTDSNDTGTTGTSNQDTSNQA